MSPRIDMLLVYEVTVCLSNCTDEDLDVAPWSDELKRQLVGRPWYTQNLTWLYDDIDQALKRARWLLPQLPKGGILLLETSPMTAAEFAELPPDTEPM